MLGGTAYIEVIGSIDPVRITMTEMLAVSVGA